MMKAKVKATGEIVNVYFRSPLWVNGDTKETYFPKELEEVGVEERENPSKNIDYWTKLEHQYAGMAMQGILGNQTYTKNLLDTSTSAKDARDIIVDASYYLAHALVKKYKKEERK